MQFGREWEAVWGLDYIPDCSILDFVGIAHWVHILGCSRFPTKLLQKYRVNARRLLLIVRLEGEAAFDHIIHFDYERDLCRQYNTTEVLLFQFLAVSSLSLRT